MCRRSVAFGETLQPRRMMMVHILVVVRIEKKHI